MGWPSVSLITGLVSGMTTVRLPSTTLNGREVFGIAKRIPKSLITGMIPRMRELILNCKAGLRDGQG